EGLVPALRRPVRRRGDGRAPAPAGRVGRHLAPRRGHRGDRRPPHRGPLRRGPPRPRSRGEAVAPLDGRLARPVDRAPGGTLGRADGCRVVASGAPGDQRRARRRARGAGLPGQPVLLRRAPVPQGSRHAPV
ncbi:MAG: hypothetical protein AVDCRST_MAG52-1703, partial [uncultured Blastococcus sp.]